MRPRAPDRKAKPAGTDRLSRALAARDRLREIRHLVDRPTVRCGQPLFEIYEQRLWRELGHSRFQAFCEAFGIRPERARVLKDVFGRYFKACGLSLEKHGDTDPDLLYLVRSAATRDSAAKIVRDARRVMAGKLGANAFENAWSTSTEDDEQPPSSPLLDTLTEENEWAGPASRRTRSDEAIQWVVAFEDSEVNDFVRGLVKLRRRRVSPLARALPPIRDPRVFPPERILITLQEQTLTHGEWAQILTGIARLESFRLAFKQAELAELLATVAKALTPEGRAELIERLRRMG